MIQPGIPSFFNTPNILNQEMVMQGPSFRFQVSGFRFSAIGGQVSGIPNLGSRNSELDYLFIDMGAPGFDADVEAMVACRGPRLAS